MTALFPSWRGVAAGLAVLGALASWRLGPLDPWLRSACGRGSVSAPERTTLLGLEHAQSLFRAHDKDEDGLLDHAASLQELGEAMAIDAQLAGGLKHGFYFRLVRGTGSPERWIAAADPVVPAETGGMHLVITSTGLVAYSYVGPAPLDPTTCAVPPGFVSR